MEVIASHLEEGQGEKNSLLKDIESVIYTSDYTTSSSLSNRILELIERHKYAINNFPGNSKEEILKTLETIKIHLLKGCLDGLYLQNIKFDHNKRFHKFHTLLQKLTSNVHLGLTMVNAVVSIGFHKFNISNGIQLSVPKSTTITRNSNRYSDINSKDNFKDLALTTSLDTLIEQISSNLKKDKEQKNFVKEQEQKNFVKKQQETSKHVKDTEVYSITDEDGNYLFCGYLMFLKCFKNVSHYAPDLIKSSHLLPHFVSSIQVISIPFLSKEESKIHADYANDVEKIQDLIIHMPETNQVSSAAENDTTNGFLSCFIKHLSTLNELGEYRDYFNSIGTRFRINFDKLDDTIDKVHTMLQSSNDAQLSGVSYVECLSNLFSVVFLFVTNIKRFPLVPVYPDRWNTVSLFVLVLIEKGHSLVMLDPASLCNHQDSELKSDANSLTLPVVSNIDKKKHNCRCGRGQAEKNLPPKCVNFGNNDNSASSGSIVKKYACRCLCFRAGEPCSDHCDCRACGNPFGVHQTKKHSRLIDQSKPHRQRNVHSAQSSLKHIMGQFNSMRRKYNKQKKKQWNFAEYTLFEYCLSQLLA